ncbi:ubiquitin carboxyl-terminal hydrolase 20-like [Senna tora]|uniref:ubiquitinyl hydrolase 1 n=1 Tax=Senna tora TaxID=362788 RepID=A0A834TVT3_9FABA|nr:ubiquitin carboxyl-terminal hydrolase 20-like [Senna tora]
MAIHLPGFHPPSYSDSVLGGVPLDDASTTSPGMPVSEATLTGSSPSSHSETLNNRSFDLSVPNQMGVSNSMSLPDEVQEDQIIGSFPSNTSLSPLNSDSKTLGNCPFNPSLHNSNGSSGTKITLDECSPSASMDTDTLDDLPPTLDGSSLPMAAAVESNYSLAFCDSDREPQEEDPEPIQSLNISFYTSLSSPKQWPSWSSSSFLPSKEDVVGAGLVNLGNTCFLNAILQCFTHTVPLVQGLRSFSHSAPCEGGIDGFCALCVLRDHIELSLTSAEGIISPLRFVDNLTYFSSFFRRHQQEDAHEFMQCVLDKLERCCLDLKNQSYEHVDNLVEKIFGGRLISKLRCCNCSHYSDTYEPLIDFSLEIENVDTLPSALESFTKVETIDEKFKCDSCKEEVSMEKQLLLDQAPSVAAFHLKRFKTDGTYVEKIDKHVEFPLELDLQPYTGGNQSNNVALKYDLYAIVVHVGFSSTSGHYFCFVRSSPDMWYRLDDSKVTRVLGDFVLSQEAYILLYAQQGTPWLSSIMEVSKTCLVPSILNTSPKSVLDNVDSLYSSNPSVLNIVSCDANASREYTEPISHDSCGGRNEVLEFNDIIDASHDTGQFQSELNQAIDSFNGSRDDNTTHAQVPCNERNVTLSSLDENSGSHEVVDSIEKGGFHPLTPPSSPGPDVFSSDTSYQIPRDHLKTKNRESCKRPLNKSPDDSQRKEAVRYLSKNVHGSRRSKLLGALTGPPGEGPSNKRKKMDSIPFLEWFLRNITTMPSATSSTSSITTTICTTCPISASTSSARATATTISCTTSTGSSATSISSSLCSSSTIACSTSTSPTSSITNPMLSTSTISSTRSPTLTTSISSTVLSSCTIASTGTTTLTTSITATVLSSCTITTPGSTASTTSITTSVLSSSTIASTTTCTTSTTTSITSSSTYSTSTSTSSTTTTSIANAMFSTTPIASSFATPITNAVLYSSTITATTATSTATSSSCTTISYTISCMNGRGVKSEEGPSGRT